MNNLQKKGNAGYLPFRMESQGFNLFLFQCRVNPMTLGCIAGSLLLRKAASHAFEKNKRSTVTSDIIEFLGKRSVCLHHFFNNLYWSSSFWCARSFTLQLGRYLPCRALAPVSNYSHARATLIMLSRQFDGRISPFVYVCWIGCYHAYCRSNVALSVVEKNCALES